MSESRMSDPIIYVKSGEEILYCGSGDIFVFHGRYEALKYRPDIRKMVPVVKIDGEWVEKKTESK